VRSVGSGRNQQFLLIDHDDYASDYGRNNARYEYLINERDRLVELIGECRSPTIPAGHAAVARAALTQVELDHERNIVCDHFGEELMVLLAQGVVPDFVWPPLPGSCSTVHWAPPLSPEEIAEHKAASGAKWASIDAEIQV
jgi:hypothetical protein